MGPQMFRCSSSVPIKPLLWLTTLDISLFFPHIRVVHSVHSQISPLFSCSSAKLQPSGSRCEPSLRLFSNFCKEMLIKPFFQGLRMRSGPSLTALQTTGRFWMRVHSRDRWERVVRCGSVMERKPLNVFHCLSKDDVQ